jgi:anthranilate synthase/aminodeoxychorismate synthase-like glutamine amidotransferase
MLVIIDNSDSFVFNIARCFRMLGATVGVVRNDQVDVDALIQLKPRGIVISPGPRTPAEAGISLTVVRALSGHLPIFGICLGHQCIGSVFGGRIVAARCPLHGQASPVTHDGEYLFAGVPSPLLVGRYHSLVVEFEESFSSPLLVTARSEEGEIMALAHRDAPTFGVQFHPESILTQDGDVLLANFLDLTDQWNRECMERANTARVDSRQPS